MKNSTQDIAAASAMLERAQQVLELTYYDWHLHERPQRRGKKAPKNAQTVHCVLGHGFAAVPRAGVYA